MRLGGVHATEAEARLSRSLGCLSQLGLQLRRASAPDNTRRNSCDARIATGYEGRFFLPGERPRLTRCMPAQMSEGWSLLIGGTKALFPCPCNSVARIGRGVQV